MKLKNALEKMKRLLRDPGFTSGEVKERLKVIALEKNITLAQSR